MTNIAQQAVTCPLPRVTIQFCTQCKWMLRAAYYAQELLSTFSVSLGEVALQPSTGGTFIVAINHHTVTEGEGAKVLWDRKADGGFPETKELKRRVRDVIEPGRDLGHVDRDHGKAKKGGSEGESKPGNGAGEVSQGGGGGGGDGGTDTGGGNCEDCR